MKSQFPSIIVLFFLSLLLLSQKNLHNESQSLSINKKSNRRPGSKNTSKKQSKKNHITNKKNKKETKKIRKRVKKEFKVKSPEPIDPEKIKLRFNLDN